MGINLIALLTDWELSTIAGSPECEQRAKTNLILERQRDGVSAISLINYMYKLQLEERQLKTSRGQPFKSSHGWEEHTFNRGKMHGRLLINQNCCHKRKS